MGADKGEECRDHSSTLCYFSPCCYLLSDIRWWEMPRGYCGRNENQWGKQWAWFSNKYYVNFKRSPRFAISLEKLFKYLFFLPQQPLNNKDTWDSDYSDDGSMSNDEGSESRTGNTNLNDSSQNAYQYLSFDNGDVLNNRKKKSFANRKIFLGIFDDNIISTPVAIEMFPNIFIKEQTLIDFKTVAKNLREIQN